MPVRPLLVVVPLLGLLGLAPACGADSSVDECFVELPTGKLVPVACAPDETGPQETTAIPSVRTGEPRYSRLEAPARATSTAPR